MTSTISIEFNAVCDIELSDVGDTFRGQIFSPCGRYAMSTYYRGDNFTNNIPSKRFYVVDLVEKNMHVYKRGDGSVYLNWVSFYFVNSCQLVFICCHATGFKQQLVQICHEEKTLKVLGERSFPYTDPTAALENIRYIDVCSHYGQTIKYEGEAKHMHCGIDSRTLMIINNRVCFPVTTSYPNVIMGLYLAIDITKLEDIYENKEVDKYALYKKQEIAYSVISTPREEGDVETVWPANLANFYSNGNIIYQWKRQPNNAPKPEPGTVNKRASCIIFNGQLRALDYEIENCQSPFHYTIHPLGLRLRWSNLTKTSVELKIENIERPIDSLFNLVKKKMLLENWTKDMKDPAIQKILWN